MGTDLVLQRPGLGSSSYRIHPCKLDEKHLVGQPAQVSSFHMGLGGWSHREQEGPSESSLGRSEWACSCGGRDARFHLEMTKIFDLEKEFLLAL